MHSKRIQPKQGWLLHIPHACFFLPIFILFQTKDKAVLFSSSSFPLFLFHLHFGSCSRASSSALTFSLPLLPSQMNDTFYLSVAFLLIFFICCYRKKISFYSNQRKELCTFHLLCNFLWFLDMMLTRALTHCQFNGNPFPFHLFPSLQRQRSPALCLAACL